MKARVGLVMIALFVAAILAAALAGLIGYQYYAADLPHLDTLADYRPNTHSVVYDAKGRVMGEFRYENQRRFVIPVSKTPQLMIDAFVAVEDEHFFEHKGVDYVGIARATWENLRAGEIKQGASTITQQVCRSLLLSPEKTLERKIKEAILAQQIESRFSKEEILHLYLNEIYFGHGAYGVEAAAQSYLNKSVGDLSLAEIALLVGLPQAPSRYNPYRNPAAALKRRRHVLKRMVDVGKIDKTTARVAADEPLKLAPRVDYNKTVAPHFTEYIRRYLMKKYGASKVLEEGLRIYSNCDLDLQDAARKALLDGLYELANRQGYTGPLKRVAAEDRPAYIETLAERRGDGELKIGKRLPGLVTKIKKNIAFVDVGNIILRMGAPGIAWVERIKRKGLPDRFGPFKEVSEIVKEGDVILVRVKDAGNVTCFLDQAPHCQGAILSMRPETREVVAMVGGLDFADSEFNRVLQAKRQPGSSFKPVVYAAALDAGMTPATHVLDTAIVFGDGWKPRNYSNKFTGEVTLREALTRSINTVTVRVAQTLGHEYIARYAKRLGITSLAGSDLSMSLGAYEVIPAELVNAYAVFASGGRYAEPIFIKKIVDRNGNILEDNTLSEQVEMAPPMENIPDISAEKKKDRDLIEGDPNSLFAHDSPGRREFMDDFRLDLRIEELMKKRSKAPSRIKEIPMPRFHRDEKGRIISRQIISRQTAFLITSMLHSVATTGTGARSNVLKKTVAGKTGTTNRNVDAWFIGFSPDYLTGVWIGNDAGSKSLGKGETGSKAALPIWIKFMEEALSGEGDKPFAVPQGIETMLIDPAGGLRAYDEQPDAYTEYFKVGTGPTAVAPLPEELKPDEFFQVDF
jgi:penicillin-binding protein 1A